MCDDQVALDIHRCLHVVADDPRADATVGHSTRIRIGERNLLVGCGQYLLLQFPELLHLFSKRSDLVLDPLRLLLRQFALLPVGGVESRQIVCNASLHLRDALGEFG